MFVLTCSSQNILLTRDRIPKIADFGQARVIDDQTFLKTVCGTPAYCAPEVLKNLTAGYSPKVDSWSMALIVYFMLTGKHSAWIESTESAGSDSPQRFQHRIYDPATLYEFNVSSKGKLLTSRDWIMAMLHLDPDARLSIEQAVQHPWLSRSVTNSHQALQGPASLNNKISA
ncbi:kinase-like protein [Clavulina sp. PMI_390]|nr:kinase-like protein [Clavulina sp. PMI_390]